MRKYLITFLLFLIPWVGGVLLMFFFRVEEFSKILSLPFLIIALILIIHPSICYWAKILEKYLK
jgi:ABC-type transport system involved in multi-copper enzyme maturation permease subunit